MQRSWFAVGLVALHVACAGAEFQAGEDKSSSEVRGESGGSVNALGGATGEGGATTLGGAHSEGGLVTAAGGAAAASGGAAPSLGGASAGGTAASTGGVSISTGGVSISAGGVSVSTGGLTSLGSTPKACRDVPAGSPSGVYRIDPDGVGAIAAFDASCDMTNDGGGWTLILNYVHKGGTNPALAARKDALPLLGADTLGSDESTVTKSWGHAAAALVTALAPTALRIQGRTSAHERIIDFVSADKNCITYFSGGTTNCKGVATSFTPGASHSALLPAKATAFMSGKADLAMTEFPFYAGGQAHFGIHGEGSRWEVDTTPATGQLGYNADTIHRVWAR